MKHLIFIDRRPTRLTWQERWPLDYIYRTPPELEQIKEWLRKRREKP